MSAILTPEQFFRANPDYMELIERIREKMMTRKLKSAESSILTVSPNMLMNMTRTNPPILVADGGNKKYYRIPNWKMLAKVIAQVRAENIIESAQDSDDEITNDVGPARVAIPPGFLAGLYGLDDLVEYLRASLEALPPPQDPFVDILLHGPPGTCKSVAADAISGLPRAVYVDAATMTKAGLYDLLVEERPEIVVIDEIDALTPRDQRILRTLQASHQLVETKSGKGRARRIPMWVRVYGMCNDITRLSPATIDRFTALPVRDYTTDEFRTIVLRLGEDRKIDEDVGLEVANALIVMGRPSIREALRLFAISQGDFARVKRFIAIQAKQNAGGT